MLQCLESGHEAKGCLHAIAGELNPLLQVRQSDPTNQPTKVSADTALSAMMASSASVLVPAQEVKIPGKGGTCIVMYETGSQITLISKSSTELMGAKEEGTSSLVVVSICDPRNYLEYDIFTVKKLLDF